MSLTMDMMNTEAIERGFLGCLILDFDHKKGRCLYSFSPEDFTNEARKTIFQTLRSFDANGKTIDALLVRNELATDEATLKECIECLDEDYRTRTWPETV